MRACCRGHRTAHVLRMRIEGETSNSEGKLNLSKPAHPCRRKCLSIGGSVDPTFPIHEPSQNPVPRLHTPPTSTSIHNPLVAHRHLQQPQFVPSSCMCYRPHPRRNHSAHSIPLSIDNHTPLRSLRRRPCWPSALQIRTTRPRRTTRQQNPRPAPLFSDASCERQCAEQYVTLVSTTYNLLR